MEEDIRNEFEIPSIKQQLVNVYSSLSKKDSSFADSELGQQIAKMIYKLNEEDKDTVDTVNKRPIGNMGDKELKEVVNDLAYKIDKPIDMVGDLSEIVRNDIRSDAIAEDKTAQELAAEVRKINLDFKNDKELISVDDEFIDQI